MPPDRAFVPLGEGEDEGMETAPEYEVPDMSKIVPALQLATAVGGVVLLVAVAHFTPLGALATVALLALLVT